MIEILKSMSNNLGYIVIIAFFVTNIPIFKKTIQKDQFTSKELILLSVIFGAFGILGTYIGTEIKGAIANTRIIGVMAGGILFGPFVGTGAGIIAGIHRLTVGYGTVTAIPCAIATIFSGFASGVIYKKINREKRWLYGFLGGLALETLEMILILILSKPLEQAQSIVESIYLPMGFANGLGILLLILLIQNSFQEKEEIAAKQAQLALEIANKTLPYFRELSNESLEKICEIIKDSIGADAVAITDKDSILAHVGIGSDHHVRGGVLLTKVTHDVIKKGQIVCVNHAFEINCEHEGCPIKSAIIAPLKEGDEVTGTLKIYYGRENAVSFSNENLAFGLSQLISTQMQLSRITKLEDLASRAEIRALQAQINPHFLFNALNTIVSFLRFDPNRARELIINLSTFMRYNIEAGENLVDLNKELEQVKAYVEIEKARFGDKLNIEFNVSSDIDVKVPSLIIQPIVENSIKHGILRGSGSGTVIIKIEKANGNRVRVQIEDDGIGIPQEIIDTLNMGSVVTNKIGIYNVNSRLKYIYGKGLNIERLKRGTRTSFEVE